MAKEAALKLPPIGRFVPSCKGDGSYEEKQCHGSTGFCWCVDEKGREWFGSRSRGNVDCPKDSKLIAMSFIRSLAYSAPKSFVIKYYGSVSI